MARLDRDAHLSRMLVLGINWDRPEIVRELLRLLPPRASPTASHPLDRALQRVYELQARASRGRHS